MMLRRIVLPLDPTKRLQAAKHYALTLARRLELPVTALYVANTHKTGTAMAGTVLEHGERGECFSPLGQREVESFARGAEGVTVETVVRCGVRPQTVALVVKPDDALVLGPFRSRWTRLFTGSEVERILEEASCHAFVVRHESPLPGPGSTALVVFDGLELSAAALDSLTGVAALFGCDLKLLHLGYDRLSGAEALDAAVESLRARVGEQQRISCTNEPLRGQLPRRLRITRRLVRTTGARLVVLPMVEGGVSELLLHELVLTTPAPVCVLR